MEKKQLLDALGANDIPYRRVDIGGGMEIILSQYGGRVYGPFPISGDGDGLFWIRPAALDGASLGEMVRKQIWNCGGDRLWVGPEIRYSVSDRTRFWETLHTPEAVDPGTWKLHENKMTQSLHLRAVGLEAGEVSFDMEKEAGAAADPLRELTSDPDLTHGLSYCGFCQRIRFSGSGSSVEPWSLLQVKPGGTILIGMTSPACGVDYYEPAAAFEQVFPWGAALKSTGSDRYKVAYKAAQVTGRLGYLCRWNGEDCLLIRSFNCCPSGEYREEPPQSPGVHGFAVHVYNDGNGGSEGFSEIECSLPAVFGSTGRSSCDETIWTWIYRGSRVKLDTVGKILLGADLSRL